MSEGLHRRKKPHRAERVGQRPCPRCNADARVVAVRDKPTSPLWEVYVLCDKCKARTWVGPISHQYKKRLDRNYELMELWKKAKTPAERGRIMVEVQRLSKEEELWERSN